MRNVAATQDAESVSDTPTLLRQYVTFVPTKQRFVALVSLLYGLAVQAYNKSRMGAIGDHSALRSIKVIIFVATCDAVDFYHQVLSEAVERFRPQVAGPDGLLSADASEIELVRPTVYKLHGSMAQPDRHAQLNAFSAGAVNRPQVLLATDIVGRGIDIPNMTHIIQFDPPNEVGDYVHRIGRTARQNREGEAWLFLSPHEHEYVNVLTNRGLRLVEKKATAVLNHFCMTPKQARVAGYRPPSRVVEAVMNKLQFDFE
ncbi:P-loop containing nucleoside triphosphate hydrolase protein, partial [Caulochytrium protostelioides]